MRTLKLLIASLIPLSVFVSSCQPKQEQNQGPLSEAEYRAQYQKLMTETKLKKTGDFSAKTFLKDGVGYMKTNNIKHVDGDTTHFTQTVDSKLAKVRYAEINTPESTAEIEKWGKSASIFTNSILDKAQTLVVTNPDLKEEPPSSAVGGRYAGLVWYSTAPNASTADLRLLNLEIVINGYSESIVTKDIYHDNFVAAQNLASRQKLNVFADKDKKDPNFYDGEAVSLTLQLLYSDEMFYFIDNQIKLSIEGVVTDVDSSGFWIQSEGKDSKIYGIYVFDLKNKLTSKFGIVGQRVSITGKPVCYPPEDGHEGLFELTSLQYNPLFPAKDDSKILKENVEYKITELTSGADLAGTNQSAAVKAEVMVTGGSGSITLKTAEGIDVYLPKGIRRISDGKGGHIDISSWKDLQGKHLAITKGVVDIHNGQKQVKINNVDNISVRETNLNDLKGKG